MRLSYLFVCTWGLAFFVILLCLPCGTVLADQGKVGNFELAFSATAEDFLMFFEEKDLVIATRHETPIRKSPAITTVITARETRDMGVRNLPAYTTVDVTMIARNFLKGFERRASVYNLFDESYKDPSPFPVQVPEDFPTNVRTFMLEAKYIF